MPAVKISYCTLEGQPRGATRTLQVSTSAGLVPSSSARGSHQASEAQRKALRSVPNPLSVAPASTTSVVPTPTDAFQIRLDSAVLKRVPRLHIPFGQLS